MNCSNHPDRLATAFCQSCGKALCPLCTRSADGLVLCEPDLLQRYPAAAQAAPASWAAPPEQPAQGTPYTQVSYAAVPTPSQTSSGVGANPVLAGFLGCIPGVGAMYNGQFIKAFLHVAIFAVLVSLDDHDFAGFLMAAWIFYQVFDAAQTAAARRDGRPLPDPLGLLEISRRLGPQNTTYPAVPPVAPSRAYTPPQPPASAEVPPPPYTPPPPTAGYTSRRFTAEPYLGVTVDNEARPGEPIGALVLIGVGLLFLLSTTGVLHGNVIARSWPLLLLGLGVWLLIRRVQGARPPVAAPRAEPTKRSPFSITPDPVNPETPRKDQP